MALSKTQIVLCTLCNANIIKCIKLSACGVIRTQCLTHCDLQVEANCPGHKQSFAKVMAGYSSASEELFDSSDPESVSETGDDSDDSEEIELQSTPLHAAEEKRLHFKHRTKPRNGSGHASSLTKETPTGRPKRSLSFANSNRSTSRNLHSSAILSTLTELTNTLRGVVERLDKTESRVHAMEQNSTTSLSSKKSRLKVSLVVRVSNVQWK